MVPYCTHTVPVPVMATVPVCIITSGYGTRTCSRNYVYNYRYEYILEDPSSLRATLVLGFAPIFLRVISHDLRHREERGLCDAAEYAAPPAQGLD